MNSFIMLISNVIGLYIWLLILQAILSWLIAFGIINTNSPFINLIGNFLYKITEPLLKPIRSFLPELGGIDISPVVLILLLMFVNDLIFEYSTKISL